ncbi:MAG: hypothetical protein ACK4R6_12070 [Spirosomataceae bacterium]
MKTKMAFLLISGMFLFSSCAKHIQVAYQTETSNTGSVAIKLNRPTPFTYVTINDQLIVNRKNVKSLTVNNLPAGEYTIHYTTESSRLKEKLDAHVPVKMEAGKEITKLIEVPPYSNGYWIYNGLVVLPFVTLFALSCY